MINDDVKSLVGENCSKYDSKYIFHNASMTNLAQSCVNCSYYHNDNCSKKLFTELYESLRVN